MIQETIFSTAEFRSTKNQTDDFSMNVHSGFDENFADRICRIVRFCTGQIVKQFAGRVWENQASELMKGLESGSFNSCRNWSILDILYDFLCLSVSTRMWNLSWFGSFVFYSHMCFAVYVWAFFLQDSKACLLSLITLSNGICFGKLLSLHVSPLDSTAQAFLPHLEPIKYNNFYWSKNASVGLIFSTTDSFQLTSYNLTQNIPIKFR